MPCMIGTSAATRRNSGRRSNRVAPRLYRRASPTLRRMAFHRRVDREPIGTTAGSEELRPARSATELATATMACPECDAPVMPAGRVRPSDLAICPFCGTSGAVREFLTLEDPARPARVVVRVVTR
jgi:hypothetical protein